MEEKTLATLPDPVLTWKLYVSALEQIKGIIRVKMDDALRSLVTEDEIEALLNSVVADESFGFWLENACHARHKIRSLIEAYEDSDNGEIPYEI
jgi:hypothetical protein